MSLRERLDQELKTAMLAKQAATVSALRNIKSVVRNKEIDTKVTLDDAGMIAILNSLKKQREDSIAQFTTGGRPELADAERAELAVIQSYLPAGLGDDEVREIIKSAIAETQAAGPKDMGKVMKVVTPKTTGRADGKMVSDLVKSLLSAT